jgi:hypothetical protein
MKDDREKVDPGRTSGQAEGLDEGEERDESKVDPGRTSGQAEGERERED